MSNKTELQSNNIDLQGILDSINALPEAGSGGGASVETCTASITHYGSYGTNYQPSIIAYTTVDDSGGISSSVEGYSSSAIESPYVLSNVVCGSVIILRFPTTVGVTVDNGRYMHDNGIHFIWADGDCNITATPVG